ncbi:MAG: hypothetical protein ACREMF_01125 [Gemmatimonadales bacterium]
MSRARRLLAGIGCALGAACSDPTVPSRTAAYPFTDLFGEVFHWPTERLPVRFYVDPRGNLGELVARAIDTWERQFLYGEFRGVVADDSGAADVLVRWSDSVPPDAPPDNGPPVVACGGLTQGILDTTGTAFAEPLVIELDIIGGTSYTPGQVQACLRRTAIHELGHTLGLLQEAADSQVIMHSPPLVAVPTERDRRTVERLYHTPPTLGPPPP